jgi:signal transduction histidine kinase
LKLRTQILLLLLLLGLAPLFAAVAINLPLVFDRIELFYHKAHLQNLRADFRDLDQHLASREEMVRLLAKLPEPGALLGDAEGEGEDETRIDMARARYTEWINQILHEQLDITQLLFLDAEGRERFWLERNRDSGKWEPTTQLPDPPSTAFFQAAMRLDRSGVLVSPIRVRPDRGSIDPRQFLTLRLISPIGGSTGGQWRSMGAVVMNIDVGGMARAYRDTLWANNDGTYLVPPVPGRATTHAFEDFPGLNAIFSKGTQDLWEGDGRQVIWVPLFVTERGEPLWVGRRVDPSPLAAFRNALTLRVLTIVFALIIAVLLVVRWFALRVDHFGQELTEGISRVLESNERVNFSWRGPRELQRLGKDLSRLAETHAQHIHSLRQHARELEQSNRYKSEFLTNVSHELRTPLNSILLLSKLLGDKKSGLTGDQAIQARVIHEAGSDLKTLIDNILDLSRMEAGQAAVHLDSIELREVIMELLELMRPQFEAKGLRLDLEYGSDAAVSILSDTEKLRQILKNFLSNAVKFTSEGGVRVGVTSNRGTDAQAYPLRISVQDTGIGIPREKQALVFEAFQQADGSTSRRYGGTGLGLSISRELAGMIGGRIELESEEGKGATFSLLLPLEFDDDRVGEGQVSVQAQAQEGETPPVRVPGASYDGQCVLLVDAEVKNLLAVTPLLENWGLKVLAAGDGTEALETLEEDKECSLLLMDVIIPDGDGYDTIRRLRADDRYRELPAVALSIEAGDEVRDACMQAGFDDLIAKPVDPVGLKHILDRFLTHQDS